MLSASLPVRGNKSPRPLDGPPDSQSFNFRQRDPFNRVTTSPQASRPAANSKRSPSATTPVKDSNPFQSATLTDLISNPERNGDFSVSFSR
jgi:hypothetical protein